MFNDSEDIETVSYWPSVSDLFLTLFIISLSLIAIIQYVLTPKHTIANKPSPVETLVPVDIKDIREPTNLIRRELGVEQLRPTQTGAEVIDGLHKTAVDAANALRRLKGQSQKFEQLASQLAGSKEKLDALKNDKPPIIKIEESQNYRFASGSALMGAEFKEGLHSVEFEVLAKEIIKRNRQGSQAVDTLEIIGHTDGQPVRREGNLDYQLPKFLSGNSPTMAGFQAGSNNDLGLMRALSVRAAWIEFVENHADSEALKTVYVRCYSAGQTIPDDESEELNEEDYLKANERARRIEMRLTKLK